MDEIETEYSTTPYRGRIEFGDIRHFADITRFHLQSASNILAVLLLGKNPQGEIDSVLKQLEIGIPANALDFLRLPLPLTRGEYLALLSNNVTTSSQMWALSEEALENLLGKSRATHSKIFRPKTSAEVAK